MSAKPDTQGPLKIVIVEDNRDARTTLRMLLSMGYGHDVYEAPDGASGVRLALEVKPDIALIDVGLPDIDGHEVARRIRAVLDRRTTVLAALTGYDSAEDRQLAREAGFDLHFVKPVQSADLARMFDCVEREKDNGAAPEATIRTKRGE